MPLLRTRVLTTWPPSELLLINSEHSLSWLKEIFSLVTKTGENDSIVLNSFILSVFVTISFYRSIDYIYCQITLKVGLIFLFF